MKPFLRMGSRRGTSVIEVGLLIPWLVFSFMGALDFGFALYGIISTQNAARVGAMWGSVNAVNAQSAGLPTQACSYALDILHYAPNVPATLTTCAASPLLVTARYVASGADLRPVVVVAVTYTVTLLPIPGIMPAQIAITRSVQMPVRN